MKFFLLLLLLVGVNANGADRRIHSITGLEGIAKEGIKILVEDYSHVDKTYDAKAIENQVKLRLKLAGIKIDNRQPSEFKEGEYPSLIYLNVSPLKVGDTTREAGKITGYHIAIKAVRKMTFEANGKTYRIFASQSQSIGGSVAANKLREGINEYMDELLLAYLKANPKKD